MVGYTTKLHRCTKVQMAFLDCVQYLTHESEKNRRYSPTSKMMMIFFFEVGSGIYERWRSETKRDT